MVKRGLETADLIIKDHHAEIVDWKDNTGEGFSDLSSVLYLLDKFRTI